MFSFRKKKQSFLSRPEDARTLVCITAFSGLLCLYAIFFLLIGIQSKLDMMMAVPL